MKNHLLDYPLVNQHSYGKSPSFIGKSTIDGPFSIAMLVYQRVISSPPFYGLKDVFLISYMHHGFWVCFFRAERGIGRLMEPNGLLPKMPKMCEKSIFLLVVKFRQISQNISIPELVSTKSYKLVNYHSYGKSLL